MLRAHYLDDTCRLVIGPQLRHLALDSFGQVRNHLFAIRFRNLLGAVLLPLQGQLLRASGLPLFRNCLDMYTYAITQHTLESTSRGSDPKQFSAQKLKRT